MKFYIEDGMSKRQTVAEYLIALENIGLLVSHKSGREILYLNTKLFKLLMGELSE